MLRLMALVALRLLACAGAVAPPLEVGLTFPVPSATGCTATAEVRVGRADRAGRWPARRALYPGRRYIIRLSVGAEGRAARDGTV